ncbi:MAG: serine hydrolase [bacterium]|nr:serine hydrolase [bacterium]
MQLPRNALPQTLALLEQGIEKNLHIGAQVYISLRGEPIADFALGESRPGIPMQTNTLMPWLSATKPIGAVAIAQLWEQGLLSPDDPVSQYIPEFGTNGKSTVTLYHLLTHTGGFRSSKVDLDRAPWEEIISHIFQASLEIDWTPGKKAGYHKATSWFILAEILQRIDGRPFGQYVREELFNPLDMNNTWIGLPPDRFQAYGNRIGHLQNTSKFDNPTQAFRSTEEGAALCRPGGGGQGPIRELGRFYEMLLGGGTWNNQRILLPQTVADLTFRHRENMFDETFKHTMDWGLGFILNSNRYGADTVPYGYGLHASPNTFGHGGAQSSAGFADPEHNLVVAQITNGTPGEFSHNRRVRQLHTAIYEDLGLQIKNGG